MNGILGFAELLKTPELSGAEQMEYIRIIKKSGERMLNIINDIVDISKIEAGQVKLFVSETRLNEQTEFLYSFFKPEVDRKGIRLTLHNGLPDKEAILNTDREKLYAVLTNLIKNAIKFTSRGSIDFGYVKKGMLLEYYVKDTGFGIPPDRLQAIFERFIQADIADSRAFQGAGLGLSISKAYVEMLGGEIWVESIEDKGSAFYFTIPYIPDSEQKILMTADINNEQDKQMKKLKILIVEDDETSEMLISIAVKALSKEILKVGSAAEAIKTSLANPDIDLILMDVKMPDMDGYEATRQIRRFNKDVYIIAQTAFGLVEEREKALDAGCNDYISKPLDIAKLKKLIQEKFNPED
jgi:CheY-like chemotaxis protein